MVEEAFGGLGAFAFERCVHGPSVVRSDADGGCFEAPGPWGWVLHVEVNLLIVGPCVLIDGEPSWVFEGDLVGAHATFWVVELRFDGEGFLLGSGGGVDIEEGALADPEDGQGALTADPFEVPDPGG